MEPNLTYHNEVLSLISPYTHRTPVLRSSTLDDELGAQFYFKAEHLQRMGAFKMRGATFAALSIPEDGRSKGLCTHSSGNHGQAVALAAKSLNIPAYIAVPNNAPRSKTAAMESYGAELFSCEPTPEAREKKALELQKKTGAYFIHPSNNEKVIWGQGTAALELLQEVPDLDIIMVAVGGGGLLAGTCLAAKSINPKIRVMAAEPALDADAQESLEKGEIVPPGSSNTIADGLRSGLGDINFPIIKTYTERILTVSEEDIASNTRWVWERMKQVIEPSAGVPVAALRTYPDLFLNKKVGIILCGGNLDLDNPPF